MMPAMRYFYTYVLVLVALGIAQAPAATSGFSETRVPAAVDTSLMSRKDRIDSFFSELKKTRDPDVAGALADDIWTEWRDSGSATANLLMQWADSAAGDKRYAAALDYLDQVITLLPNYSEGWNKRATLHYQMNNYRKSMADISKVLELEPRHFGALAGMAAILEQTGHDGDAAAAWQKMLEVYPANREAQQHLSQLLEKLAGGRT